MGFHPFTAAQKLHSLFEPSQCYWRSGRLGGAADTLPVAHLDPAADCTDPHCRELIDTWLWYTAKYKQVGARHDLSVFKPTATILDLDQFSDFDAFAKAASRASDGNVNRAVKKAARGGYVSRRIPRGSYDLSIEKIRSSKRFRSGGPVLNAFFNARAGLTDRVWPYQAPACNEHWIIEWAVFPPADRGASPVAHAAFQRVGNMARVMVFMGHGDFLAEDVVKLLTFDVIVWLLTRDDPAVRNLRYFFYGAAEHGNYGLFKWKRRMQFKPHILNPAAVANLTGR